jgi:hypothetical protein
MTILPELSVRDAPLDCGGFGRPTAWTPPFLLYLLEIGVNAYSPDPATPAARRGFRLDTPAARWRAMLALPN